MPPTFTSSSQLLQNASQAFLSSIQLFYSNFLTLLPGNPVLAILEAITNQTSFLQMQAFQVVNFARVTTCSGSDVDSFLAQFQFTRIPGTTATGQVTVYAPGTQTVPITVPLTTIIQNVSGTISYQLIADTTQAAWNATANAYIIPAGQASIAVSVQATQVGASFNVLPNQLTQIQTANPGIISATNLAAITNGLNPESDNAYRARFVLWLNSLSKGTAEAYQAAALSVASGYNFYIDESPIVGGVPKSGQVNIVVNNPGQNVSSQTLSAIAAQISSVRALGVQTNVVAATPLTATINISIYCNTNEAITLTITNVQNAILNYVNSLQIGQTLYMASIIDVAINADSNVISVEWNSLTINGVSSDLACSNTQVIQTNSSIVSVVSV